MSTLKYSGHATAATHSTCGDIVQAHWQSIASILFKHFFVFVGSVLRIHLVSTLSNATAHPLNGKAHHRTTSAAQPIGRQIDMATKAVHRAIDAGTLGLITLTCDDTHVITSDCHRTIGPFNTHSPVAVTLVPLSLPYILKAALTMFALVHAVLGMSVCEMVVV